MQMADMRRKHSSPTWAHSRAIILLLLMVPLVVVVSLLFRIGSGQSRQDHILTYLSNQVWTNQNENEDGPCWGKYKAASSAPLLLKRKHYNDTVDCPSLLSRIRRGGDGNLTDPNQGQLFARYTKLFPHFWVSLHNQDYDPVRYGTLHYGKYYEKQLSRAFTDILLMEDDHGEDGGIVVDVGGNIGWFTLLSAAMGHTVHVLEPNPINVIRLCESICLNGWEACHQHGPSHPPPLLATPGTATSATTNTSGEGSDATDTTLSSPAVPGQIYIRTLGLKDTPGEFWLRPNGLSPGALKVVEEEDNATGAADPTRLPEGSQRVQLTTLDILARRLGWLSDSNNNNNNPAIPDDPAAAAIRKRSPVTILKVDVEGAEPDVFRGGRRFLEARIAQNIFTEGNVESPPSVVKFESLVRQLLEAGYRVYKLGGSSGPGRTDVPDGGNRYEDILWACQGFGGKKRRRQCNIWWRLKDLPDVKEVAKVN